MSRIWARMLKWLKQDFYIPLIMFAVISLVYPFANLPPVYIKVPRYYFQLFPPALVSSLALCLILFNYKRIINAFKSHQFPFYCMTTFLVVSFWHILSNDKLTYADLCYSLAWLTLPLIAYLFAKEFIKYLPWYMLGFWGLNLAYNIIMVTEKLQQVGLPGNRNWNGTLIAATTPFAVYYIWQLGKRVKLKMPVVTLIAGIAVLGSLFFLLKAESRGANLALIISILLFIFFSLPFFFKKVIILSMALVIVLGSLTAILYGTDGLTSKAVETIKDDIRPAIWESTFALISQHPIVGVGRAAFESELHENRNVEYFLHRHAAVRTNHPHNHFLYIIACYGFLVFSAWIFLLIYPVIFCLLKLPEETSIKFKLIFFSFLVMFIHAMFDLIFYEWPSNILGPLIAGLLWFKIWPYSQTASIEQIPGSYNLFIKCAACLLLGLTLFEVNISRKRTSAVSNAKFYKNVLEDDIGMIYYYDKSIQIRPEAMNNYHAGVSSFATLQNPDLAIKYFDELKTKTPFTNLAHNHGFTGLSYFRKGKPRHSLPFLLKEVKMYPISINGWYNLSRACHAAGRSKQALYAQKMVEVSLTAKGFKKEDLPVVLANPQFDLKPSAYFSTLKDSGIQKHYHQKDTDKIQ